MDDHDKLGPARHKEMPAGNGATAGLTFPKISLKSATKPQREVSTEAFPCGRRGADGEGEGDGHGLF